MRKLSTFNHCFSERKFNGKLMLIALFFTFFTFNQQLSAQQLDLRKGISSVSMNAPVDNHALISFELEICNLTIDQITDVQISDNIGDQLNPGFLGITAGPTDPIITQGMPPNAGLANGGFNGTGNNNLLSVPAVLNGGDCIQTSFEIEVDLSLLVMPDYNQASGSGLQGGIIIVGDLSDSDLPSAPDGPLNTDDPTPVCLPDVALAKEFIGASPVPNQQGIYNVSFQFNVLNNGCSALTSVTISDDFATEFGGAYVSTVSSPQPAVSGIAPLQPGQTQTVIWEVQVDMTEDDAQTGLTNIASVVVSDVNGVINSDQSTDGTDPLFGDLATEIDLDAFPCTADASWNPPVSPVCEVDPPYILNISNLTGGLSTGDPDNDAEVIWTGNGVTDNGTDAAFDPAGLSGPVLVCAEVSYNSQCSDLVCYEINVIETPVIPASVTIDQTCSIGATGNVALTSLFPGVDFTNPGWVVTGSNVVGGAIVYNASGCYEATITYTGPCAPAPNTVTSYVLVSEQPQPSFSIQNQACWNGVNFDLPAMLNSPVYSSGTPDLREFSIEAGPATVDPVTGLVTITGTGIVAVRLTETINYEDCGDIVAGSCTEVFDEIINVGSGSNLDANFIFPPGTLCAGVDHILVANQPGGVFSGLDVQDNGNGTGILNGPIDGTYLVTYSITSPEGCVNSMTQEVVLGDENAPDLNASCSFFSNLNLDANDACVADSPSNPFDLGLVSDACNMPAIGLSINWQLIGATNGSGSGNDFSVGIPALNPGVTTVIYTITNLNGASSICSYSITVTDNTPPVLGIECPADQLDLACGEPIPALLRLEDFNATDNCTGADELVLSVSEVLIGAPTCPSFIGTIQRTYTIADEAGNSVSCVQLYSYATDNNGPTLNSAVPQDVTVECSDPLPIIPFLVFEDDCGSGVIVDFSETYQADPSCLSGYTLTRNWIAYDVCGNSSSAVSQTIVVQDMTAPLIFGGEDMLMQECIDPPAGNYPDFDYWLTNNAGAIATDNCNSVTWTNDYNPDNWVQMCGNAQYIDVVFTATDICGNNNSIERRYGIGDVTSPVFSNCPRPIITAFAPENWCEAFVNFEAPQADDNCSAVTISQIGGTEYESGDLFPVGITVLTWVAEDACGNTDTCSLKIVVNDYHIPPSIECPGDASAVNDAGVCGANVSDQLGIDLSPVTFDDNCIDNAAVIYEVRDETGEITGCGVNTVNGFIFPIGVNTVTYTIQDQPVLLITEVVQSAADAMEVTNFGPASLDISCLVITRTGVGAEEKMVPINTVLEAGEVYVMPFDNNIDRTDAAGYQISLKGTILDVVATNGYIPSEGWSGVLDGGDVFRKYICDHDSFEDWEVAIECTSSLGALNPELESFESNGTQTGIQTVVASSASCSFVVNVEDIENPVCASHTEMLVTDDPETFFTGFQCAQQTISVEEDMKISQLNVVGLEISYPEVEELVVSLTGPSGHTVLLFEGLCAETEDVAVSLSDTSVVSVTNAPCDPLGNEGFYAPTEALSAFCGLSTEGDWTLTVYANGDNEGLVDAWGLQFLTVASYDQTDVELENDPDHCGAQFDWTHPVFDDNCCFGTIEVEYSSIDADTLPESGVVVSGSAASEFFGVGTTMVLYILTDESGNTGTCSFLVTVIDTQGICLPPCQSNCEISCIGQLNISLDQNCTSVVTPHMASPDIALECNYYYTVIVFDPTGNPIPTSPMITEDYLGMILTFSITEPECNNSCWGNILVEDKFPPAIECVNDTLTCGELIVHPAPVVTENCSSYELVLLNETIQDVSCTDPNLDRIITRTYQAVDEMGNESNICSQTLSIEKFDLNTIDMPEFDTLLSCSAGFAVDANGHPDPSVTGAPSLNGVSLWPDSYLVCNTIVEYSDIELPSTDCFDKIMRTWKVTNWYCAQDQERFYGQLLTIMDTIAPVLNCPPPAQYTTGNMDCEALVPIILPVAIDNCNNDGIEIDVAYPGGFFDDYKGGQSVILGVGDNVINYTVYDKCGNSSSCSSTITVSDETQPIAVCEQFTVISLTADGTALLPAIDVDDGSFDECALKSIQIARMNDNCGDPSNLSFGEAVSFCCEDIGEEQMVMLLVTDAGYNTNMCMVSVEVQDNLPPVKIASLPDITVSCTFDFDPNNLEVFGKVVFDPADQEDIVITADYLQFSGPAKDAVVIDNCFMASSEEQSAISINNCGLGQVVRTINIMDVNDEVVMTCVQTITFVNDDPFSIEDVVWPSDYTIYNGACGIDDLDPEDLPAGFNEPVYYEDECDLVGHTYEDQVFANVPNAPSCATILRTWYVTDWCNNVDGTYEIFEYVQEIKMFNTIDPVIDGDCSDRMVCNYDADCGPGYIELVQSATDDCTPEANLDWSYSIDLFSDGIADVSGNSNSASGYYDVGVHTITWVVSDHCGNVDFCAYTFEIRNCKQPTPICINGLSLDLIPMDTDGDGIPDAEMATVTPDYFDGGSNHPCGYDIQLSFSSDINDTEMIFDCDDLGTQTIELWVTDSNGNQDFCSTYVIVEDNNDVDICPEQLNVDVAGEVFTEKMVGVEEVLVELVGSPMSDMTKEDGIYIFEDMETGGGYVISPSNNKDPMNGVSTLDLVFIQKHILGLKSLDSPYKLIAADINNSGNVTAADLLELRKLILGMYAEFPNNTSWRFIDANQDFADPANPWLFGLEESYNIDELDNDMIVNFVGVKTGDVNDSAIPNGLMNTETRNTSGELLFSYEDQKLKPGESVWLPVYASDFNDLIGFQFTLNFNADIIEVLDVRNAALNMNGSNVNLEEVQHGYLPVSWNNTHGVTVDSESPLFELLVRARGANEVQVNFSSGSEITIAEAYNSGYELLSVNWAGTMTGIADDAFHFTLHQNEPNPWSDQTVLQLDLAKDADLELKVTDMQGKLIYQRREKGHFGVNLWTIDKNDIPVNGVLYFEISDGVHSQIRKMIRIK